MRLALITATIILGVSMAGQAKDNGKAVNVERLLDAIAQVESGSRADAVGDSGNAVGILQIWPIMVKDVNRISGKDFTLKDRCNKQKSYEMCRIYLNHYCKGMSDFNKSRCWNGGCYGHKKKATIPYAKKVMKAMK
ncbi:MAG: transglycosylase SLT domain-containing protein [Candidatus Micrarchaeia archaeon]